MNIPIGYIQPPRPWPSLRIAAFWCSQLKTPQETGELQRLLAAEIREMDRSVFVDRKKVPKKPGMFHEYLKQVLKHT
jgi:hypothetical protein